MLRAPKPALADNEGLVINAWRQAQQFFAAGRYQDFMALFTHGTIYVMAL